MTSLRCLDSRSEISLAWNCVSIYFKGKLYWCIVCMYLIWINIERMYCMDIHFMDIYIGWIYCIDKLYRYIVWMLCMDLFYKTILLIVLRMYYFDILYKCISWIYSGLQNDSILIGSLSTLVITHASEESGIFDPEDNGN